MQKGEDQRVKLTEVPNTCAKGPSSSLQLPTDAHSHLSYQVELYFTGSNHQMLKKHSVEKLVCLRLLVLIQQALVNNYIGFHFEDCNVGQNGKLHLQEF